MIPNSECLQLNGPDRPVPCRGLKKHYPGGVCQMTYCVAAEVLNDPEKHAKVVPEGFGPDHWYGRELVFHRICPGANNRIGGFKAYCKKMGIQI